MAISTKPKLSAAALTQLVQGYDVENEKRLALGRELKALEERCSGMKLRIIEHMINAKSTAVGYKRATFTLVEQKEPTIENWDKLYAHIIATGEFDLMYKRVNPAAVKARWEADVKLPGVASIPVFKLSRKKL